MRPFVHASNPSVLALSLLMMTLSFSSINVRADGAVVDNHIPDFYQQPGSAGPRSYAAGPDGTETIDPFSGMVQLNYTDLVVPGLSLIHI